MFVRPGRSLLQEALGLCSPPASLKAAQDLMGWIQDGIETMVQYGYPYPTSFYNPVPVREHVNANVLPVVMRKRVYADQSIFDEIVLLNVAQGYPFKVACVRAVKDGTPLGALRAAVDVCE